jgi:hypothetical protein
VALQIELTPTLDHCIETTARQEFSRITADYLGRGERDGSLEAKIELLRAFLESADFRDLRVQSEPHLVRGKTVRFILTLQDGRPDYTMKVGD